MREILFRGKGTSGFSAGKWIEGFYVKDFWAPASSGHGIIPADRERGGYCEVYPDTVGQFTGVTANEKKIFEGDIVKGLFLFGMEIMAVVVFRDGAFGLQWNRGEVTEFSAFTSLCNVQYEVVGNIYDNPELLNGGNEE